MTEGAIAAVSQEIVNVQETSITELDLLSCGVQNVESTVENLIDLITVDKVSERHRAKVSVALVLSTLHGVHIQLQEVNKKLRDPHPTFAMSGPPSEVERALRVSLSGAEERAEELRSMVQTQQDRIRELEADERRSGVWEKIKQQEAAIDSQKAKISYFEEFERKVKAERKKSRKRRRDLTAVKKLAAEAVANKINRSHDECSECMHKKALPPLCPGHAAGDVMCHLFVPQDLPEE